MKDFILNKMLLKSIYKRIIGPFYQRYYLWYHTVPRKYTYHNVWTIVNPTVFSPNYTVSTKVFLDFISMLDMTNKNVLEVGCGSGIISIYCASQKANIIASDINRKALAGIEKASKRQNLKVKTIYSDLFQSIPNLNYDFIFINPPYYPKKANNDFEKAWYCGEEFEYFNSLFRQLPKYILQKTSVYMILSEDCEIETISNFAIQQKLSWIQVYEIKKQFERNYIFKISNEIY